MYSLISKYLTKIFKKSTVFKYGFNISPMYRRSTGRVVSVTDDLFVVKIKIPLSYKNKNYVGSIFGGSLLSATDPIYMIQLINILGDDYVIWDKDASIKFKRPAKETVFADFVFTSEEIEKIKQDVSLNKEIDLVKNLHIINKEKSVVFAEVSKTIYIANKQFYKEKRNKK